MSDDTQQPIIAKKIKKIVSGGHGGAWKIAYADFVTAMMAFFLMMWLIGSTSQGDLAGIAEFFQNPLKVAQQGGDGSGDSSSIIPGGGEDLSREVGQVLRGDIEGNHDLASEAEGDAEILERERLLDLKIRLEAMIEADESLRSMRDQILIDVNEEGLRIQLIDERNRPMFDTSSDVLLPHSKELLYRIGRLLNDVPNRVSISGHTDAKAYAGGQRGFSNWELSANRANASRRELIVGGMDPQKVIRVVGLADSAPFIPDNPLDPANRRISIFILTKKSEQNMRSDVMTGGETKDSPADAAQQRSSDAAQQLRIERSPAHSVD